MNEIFTKIGGYIASGDAMVNHDNTLSGNGTVASPLRVVPGYNETVLWSGDDLSAVVSESISNFETVKIYAHWTYNGTFEARTMTEIPGTGINFNLFAITPTKTDSQDASARVYTLASLYAVNGLELTPINKSRIQYAVAATNGTISSNSFSDTDVLKLNKVIGINRKQ